MEVKKIFNKIKSKIGRVFKADKAFPNAERKKLEKLVRYQSATINFYGKQFKIVDSLTFLNSYNEIFTNNIYKFISSKKDITIIDCGANIGLATVYFKMNYPSANIIAFEPDPIIFEALSKNISSFGYNNIICKNEAISNTDTILDFKIEGGHSGMIVYNGDLKDSTKVKATRLKSLLSTYGNITFLKIDIEGEEINVIPDIADELINVDYLFVEYHSFIDSTQQLDNLLYIIKSAGFRYYIKEAANKSLPFIQKDFFLKMDMLVNIFCYRDSI